MIDKTKMTEDGVGTQKQKESAMIVGVSTLIALLIVVGMCLYRKFS